MKCTFYYTVCKPGCVFMCTCNLVTLMRWLLWFGCWWWWCCTQTSYMFVLWSEWWNGVTSLFEADRDLDVFNQKPTDWPAEWSQHTMLPKSRKTIWSPHTHGWACPTNLMLAGLAQQMSNIQWSTRSWCLINQHAAEMMWLEIYPFLPSFLVVGSLFPGLRSHWVPPRNPCFPYQGQQQQHIFGQAQACPVRPCLAETAHRRVFLSSSYIPSAYHWILTLCMRK